ncbi:hypothetical protein [Geodermatophilus sp. SYSU D01119]
MFKVEARRRAPRTTQHAGVVVPKMHPAQKWPPTGNEETHLTKCSENEI